MIDEIQQRSVYVDTSGHLILRYIAADGTRSHLDLTEEISRIAANIAAEKVQEHRKDYHGG
jgi:hypothetical protein